MGGLGPGGAVHQIFPGVSTGNKNGRGSGIKNSVVGVWVGFRGPGGGWAARGRGGTQKILGWGYQRWYGVPKGGVVQMDNGGGGGGPRGVPN